jgi:hypothetical protein
VKFLLTKADGSTAIQTAITGSNGSATWNYKLNAKSPRGTYSVSAQATSGTQTAISSSVTFAVQ